MENGKGYRANYDRNFRFFLSPLVEIVTPWSFVVYITVRGSSPGKPSWGKKSYFLDRVKGMVYFMLIFILFSVVNVRKSASWCRSTDCKNISIGSQYVPICRQYVGPSSAWITSTHIKLELQS